jgi:hypothetical protein
MTPTGSLCAIPPASHAGAGASASTPAHIWNFYKVASPPTSKTYAGDDTSHAVREPAADGRSAKQRLQRITARAQMLDALMIGFALVFFISAAAYTFLCDRL